MSTTCSRVHT